MLSLGLAVWLSCTPSDWNSEFHSNFGQSLYLDSEQGHLFGTGYCLSSILFFLWNHPEEPKINWTSKFIMTPILNHNDIILGQLYGSTVKGKALCIFA